MSDATAARRNVDDFDRVRKALLPRAVEYYSQYLGDAATVNGKLAVWHGCPRCNSTGDTESFKVKVPTGQWFCHRDGCESGGDVFSFLTDYNLVATKGEALRTAAQFAGVEIDPDTAPATDEEPPPLGELTERPQDNKPPKLEHLIVGMDQVEAAEPVYRAGGMVREGGVHLWWAPPNWYKTYLCAWLAMEMTQREEGERLFGVPGMEINRPWQCVLWLGDEESAAEWKWRAENLARGGHGLQAPGAELQFADATAGPVMLTTDNVLELIDQTEAKVGKRVDAVFIDPLPNMLPEASHRDGDPNPSALARVCRPLRRIAKQRGVSIYMLTHPNASGTRERGATAYRGSADVVVEIKFDSGKVSLVDLKNRDREKSTVSFVPEWDSAGDQFSLTFTRTTNPVETEAQKMQPGKRAMYSAAQAGAGRITKTELFEAKYSTRKQEDVSLRTKQRWWKELVEADLVTDDNGIVRLIDSRDDEEEPAT